MAEISRVALFGKLNQVGYRSIEAATVSCKMRGNPVVELQHWIHQILQLQDSDLHRIIKQFDLEPSRLAADITDSLERLPRGSTTISDLSANVEEAVERGWVFGDCTMDLGMPSWLSWLALDKWLPWLFEVQTTCGYTPLIAFNITMAETLLVFSVLLVIAGVTIFLASWLKSD